MLRERIERAQPDGFLSLASRPRDRPAGGVGPENHVAIGEISIPLLLTFLLGRLQLGRGFRRVSDFLQSLSQNVPDRRIIGEEADRFFELHGGLLKLALFAEHSPKVAMRFARSGVGLECTAQLRFRGGKIALGQQKRSLCLVALCIVSV